jgi:hypothetical protein
MPLLDLYQPISFFDMVKALSPGHPVFLIACEDDDSHLIIKQENQTPATDARKALNHNLKAMAQVSPALAGSKALIPQEVAVLKVFVRVRELWSRRTHQPEPADVDVLRRSLVSPGPWFKMAEAEDIVDLKSAIQDLKHNQDKTGVRAIARSLNDPGGFERLGQIVAVDLYNHNADRFTWMTAGDLNPMSATNERFKTIGNLGNVLAAMEDGTLRPVGLDSFDPASEYADVEQTIQQLDMGKQQSERWGGHLLGPQGAARRRKFAQDIYDDLQAALGPRHRRLFFLNKRRLHKDGPLRILRGMDQAISKLRQMLDQKVNKASPPRGLASRLAVLG